MDELLQTLSEDIFRSKWTLQIAAAIGELEVEFASSALVSRLKGSVPADAVYRILREFVDASVLEHRGSRGSGRYKRRYSSFFQGAAAFAAEVQEKTRPRRIRSAPTSSR